MINALYIAYKASSKATLAPCSNRARDYNIDMVETLKNITVTCKKLSHCTDGWLNLTFATDRSLVEAPKTVQFVLYNLTREVCL